MKESFWQALLFIPANKPKYLQKAPTSRADGVVLDLEDAIPLAEKANARNATIAMAQELNAAGMEVHVRVNRPMRLLVKDLEAVIHPTISAVMLTKVDSAEFVQEVANIISELEQEQGMEIGCTKLSLLVETAKGFLNLREITNAHKRIFSIALGTEDLANEMNMVNDQQTALHFVQHLVVCAAEADIAPTGIVGSIADIKDLDRYRAALELSKKIGLQGTSCIHPKQIAVVKEVYRPSDKEIAEAKGIIAAYEEGIQKGIAAVSYNGRMIDLPIVEKAKKVLQKL